MNNKNDKKDIVVPNNERGPINGDTERRSGYSRDNVPAAEVRPIITTSQETGETKPKD
jgi:hypothetical protein